MPLGPPSARLVAGCPSPENSVNPFPAMVVIIPCADSLLSATNVKTIKKYMYFHVLNILVGIYFTKNTE
jgi:hypothetical protein